MKQMTEQAFQQAQTYLITHGRTVDQARFTFHFANGNVSAVLDALVPYQNDDGGFGNALEPDLRTSASSAIATQQGFNILREIDADESNPIVQKAINYLLATLDEERLRWEIVPATVEDAPHAPWWTYAKIEKNFDGFLANPRAALIGFLHAYQSLVPAALLTRLLEAQMTHLLAHDSPSAIDMHDLYCYLTLNSSPQLPAHHQQQLEMILRNTVRQTVTTDPANFESYALLPLDVASTPDAPFSSAVPSAAIDAHLDHLIATQLPDGSWPLPWSWEFVDQDAWQQAERDWKGQIVVNRLKTMAAYNRIAFGNDDIRKNANP